MDSTDREINETDDVMDTPVVFIVFNRPVETARVFAEIRKARPTKLLLIADGPRPKHEGEAARCAEARRIATQVDWPCEVLECFSEINLGCRSRVSSGLDWAFSQVEEAIVLEDDCLPDPSFFRFCHEMLGKYRSDQRIGMVCGSNFRFGETQGGDSYYFSNMVRIWGWATWSDRWRGIYDVDMKMWPEFKSGGWLRGALGYRDEAHFWSRTFDYSAAGKIDSWDTQWVFANWIQSRLSIVPNRNLISNIGFGPDATHTFGKSRLANVPTQALPVPLNHPRFIVRNARLDRQDHRLVFHRSIARRIFDRLSLYYRRLRRK